MNLPTRLKFILCFRSFYIECALWLGYFIISSIVILLKRLSFDELAKVDCLEVTEYYTHVKEGTCGCSYLYPVDQYREVGFDICLIFKHALISLNFTNILGFTSNGNSDVHIYSSKHGYNWL